MLLLLPMAVLLVLYLTLAGYRSGQDRSPWQGDVLIAVAFWGMLVALIVEILGAFHLITRPALALAWIMVLIATVTASWRRGWLQAGWSTVGGLQLRLTTIQKVLLAGVVIIVAALFLVAVVSPPNNVDSLLYHMSRVMHWAQNRSLAHYATGYDHQLLKPPWAEMSILNLRVLWGNDQLVNLVQWTSMVGSIVGVTGIVALLGGRWGGQILAAAFAASIPMGVLQSTSTQNDYVAAFWVVCLAYFAVLNHQRRLARLELLAMAGALGLGFLTKGTFYVYAPPLMIWFLLAVLRRSGLGQAVRAGFLVGLVVLILNIGFWSRNIVTYGGPFGSSNWLRQNLTIGRLPQPPEQYAALEYGVFLGRNPTEGDGGSSSPLGLAGWALRRVASLAALNLVTPSSAVNAIIRDALERVPVLFGPELFERMDEVAWSHEDTATNPLHLLFVPISLGVLFLIRPRNLRLIVTYGAASLAAYTLVALVIGHGTTVWGLRYQLPFFVIWAPVVGAAIGAAQWPAVASMLSGLFLLAALPWVLLNNMRPVIGMPPWPTRTESIFEVSSEELLFAIAPHAREPFEIAIETILESGCNRVGLRMDSGDLEYVVWWMLDAPQSGIRVETIYTQPHLTNLIDREFRPCAIVCTICEGEQLHGLPLVDERRGVALYFGPGFVSDPGGQAEP